MEEFVVQPPVPHTRTCEQGDGMCLVTVDPHQAFGMTDTFGPI
jgi:hypothetical protein